MKMKLRCKYCEEEAISIISYHTVDCTPHGIFAFYRAKCTKCGRITCYKMEEKDGTNARKCQLRKASVDPETDSASTSGTRASGLDDKHVDGRTIRELGSAPKPDRRAKRSRVSGGQTD